MILVSNYEYSFCRNLDQCNREYEIIVLMPRSLMYGSPRRFHYGSNPTDDPENDNFRSPIRMHNASTTTYYYGCNTEVYELVRIVTGVAGSYPWLILRQIREFVTWA